MVINLSNPSTLVSTLETYLFYFQTCVTSVLSELSAQGSPRPMALQKQCQERYAMCEDPMTSLHPIPIPWTLVGTFHDVYVQCPLPCQLWIRRYLRYMCHVYGGHLVFLNALSPSPRSSWIHAFAFPSSSPTTTTTTATTTQTHLPKKKSQKPLSNDPWTWAGSDHFKDIFQDGERGGPQSASLPLHTSYAQFKSQVQQMLMNFKEEVVPTLSSSSSSTTTSTTTPLEVDLKTQFPERRIDVECIY
ncbi:hypothetical protein HMI56_003784 [Coelomomyces lativittatus]|nr:hypothetical protein HMI56_003784 [Coelomomyces lativittatus]